MSILVYGYHSTCNFGDILMLDSFLERAKVEGVEVFHTAKGLSSYNYWVDKLLFVVRVSRSRSYLARFEPLTMRLLSRVFEIERVVLCGGTHIQEYGKTVSSGIEGLYKLMYSFNRIKIPFDLIGIGVNRLDNERNIFYALKALELAHFVSVRDREALHNINALGIELNGILVGADMAFSSSRFRDVSHRTSVGKDRKVALVNMINPRSIKESQERLDYFVHLVKALKDDGFVTRLFLAESFHDADLLSLFSTIVDEVYMFSGNLQEALQFIGSCQVAVAERYHVLLSCSAMNIPCFTPVYNEKTRNLLSSLGAEQFEIDYSELQNSSRVVSRINNVLNSNVQEWYPMFENLRQQSEKIIDAYFELLKRSLSNSTISAGS